jgi:Leucine-rich repeat (LRR) protein
LNELRELDLSGNNLESLPGQLLRGMPRLRGLNMANNSIGAFERGTFESVTCLETLDLSANPVEAIKAGLFCSLVNLTSLNLDFLALKSVDPGAFLCEDSRFLLSVSIRNAPETSKSLLRKIATTRNARNITIINSD